MGNPGILVLTPLAAAIWKLADRCDIPLGRAAPWIFGLAIGRWPRKVKWRKTQICAELRAVGLDGRPPRPRRIVLARSKSFLFPGCLFKKRCDLSSNLLRARSLVANPERNLTLRSGPNVGV